MVMDLAKLLEKAETYLPKTKTRLIREAYEYAESLHQGQLRLSGEPYIEHPLQTAMYLADLYQDATTLAAALLHDVMEDCGVARQELQDRFGNSGLDEKASRGERSDP